MNQHACPECEGKRLKKESLSIKIDKKSIYFVVDDICTTGATLENCAKTLKSAGIRKVYGLVIARALKN